MKLEIYLKSITALVDHAREKEAPFAIEDLALHLNDEASRHFANAQLLRYHAQALPVGSEGRRVMEENGELFENYSLHCATEAARLLGTFDANEVDALRRRIEREARAKHAADLDFPRPFGALPFNTDEG
jgi:hypothetical protein